MANTLHRLADWARELHAEALPPAVLERARLQHLSAAATVRALKGRPMARALRKVGGQRGAATVVTGGTAPRRDAARLHAGLVGWLGMEDTLFLAHPGPGAVSAAWAWGRGHSVGEVLSATVAANEIAGRIGASLLFGPATGAGCAPAQAAAAVVAAGLLEGLDADRLAHALALALAAPQRVPMAVQLGGDARVMTSLAPIMAGLEALELAMAGVTGPTDLLDRSDGLFEALSWVPLRAAFTGLGQTWLTNTLSFSLSPGHPYTQVPVQAVAEVLKRHVKAAEKRLRHDQIDRIEVSVGAPGFALDRLMSGRSGLDPATVACSTRRLIAVQSVAYELGPDQLSAEWLAANEEKVTAVVGKVEVRHDWGRTLALVEHMVDVAAPLFAGLNLSDLQKVGMRAQGVYGGGLPTPGAADLLAVVKARPRHLLERIQRASPDLADARLDEWQLRLDAEVKVHTTRGGTWPERRTIPEGSPGWPWEDTVARVHARWGEAAAAHALTAVDSGAAAEGWIEALLA